MSLTSADSALPAPVPPRTLRRWDLILGALFLLLFWAGAILLSTKGIVAVGGIIGVAIAFLFPRAGLALLLLLETALVTMVFFAAINLVPVNRGGYGTIGWVTPYDFPVTYAAVGVIAVLWAGAGFRAIVEGQRWILTPLERALLGTLALSILWVAFSIHNGFVGGLIAYDLHILLFWSLAVLVGRTLEGRDDWLRFIALLFICSILHAIALAADLLFGGVLVNPDYVMDALRYSLGNSPDLVANFIPILLALDTVLVPQGSAVRWITRPTLVYFTLRLVAELARSATAQVLISGAILAVLLKPGERRSVGRLLGGTLVLLILGAGLLAVASPSYFRLARLAVLTRLLDVSGNKSQDNFQQTGEVEVADFSSDKYRIMETEVALEQMQDYWVTGQGPGGTVMKRFSVERTGSDETYLHNGYLWYILKFGIVGIGMLIACYTRFFQGASRILRHPELPDWMRALTAAYFAAVIPLLLFASTNNIIGAPAGIFFLMPGFALVCYGERVLLKQGE